jgi:spore maturation protein CgeB
MRIGVIGPMFPDSFADNVTDSLRRMGHEVDPLGSTYRTNRSKVGAVMTQLAQSSQAAALRLQRRIVARATNTRYDVVITVEATLLPEAVEQIKGNGSAVALWFTDAVSNLGRQLMFLADYDLICLKDSELVRRCRAALAINVIYLPEACNPSWHLPSDTAIEPVVVVAGNMHAFRLRLLERLVRAGIPLRIYGPRWASWLRSELLQPCYTGQYLARENKARVLRSAGVVLNTLHLGEMSSVNCRLFEAAGCGAAVLTDVRPDLEGLFEVGTEVATFDSFDGLVDQVRWMLDHPGAARVMGERAAIRAHADHTYDRRLGTLLAALS